VEGCCALLNRIVWQNGVDEFWRWQILPEKIYNVRVRGRCFHYQGVAMATPKRKIIIE